MELRALDRLRLPDSIRPVRRAPTRPATETLYSARVKKDKRAKIRVGNPIRETKGAPGRTDEARRLRASPLKLPVSRYPPGGVADHGGKGDLMRYRVSCGLF
jgi:hypothetical protein